MKFQSNHIVLYIKLKPKKFVIQCNLFHEDICIGIENIQLLKMLVSKYFWRIMADFKIRIKC